LSRTGPTNPRVLFLIPARGGSKGLPGKNLAPVGGIPLVGRAARLGRLAARSLGAGSRVVCSTDDPRIADTAREWGAEAPFLRPPELASDGARSIDVAFHALEALPDDFDALVLLQPTSPLTEVDDVLKAIALHQEGGLPVVSVCPAEHPAEWLYAIDQAGRLARLLAVAPPDQRQQARQTFRANGAVYVSSPASLRNHDSFFGAETRAFVMPNERSVDIDSVNDLQAARAWLASRPVQPVKIAGHSIGAADRCFVIADGGVNDTGDLRAARAFVDAAVASGADAVKFEPARTGALDEKRHGELLAHCQANGIVFLSTPRDETGADVLDALGVEAFRMTEADITNLRLVRHVAGKHKPVVLAIEQATLPAVSAAVDAMRDAGNRSVVLLRTIDGSADGSDASLRGMAPLRDAFGLPAGVSDRTIGDAIPFAAVALGASVIEKPLTLDRARPGSSHEPSTEAEAFRRMIGGIRAIERAIAAGERLA